MKKRMLLITALLALFSLSGQMQAYYWVKLINWLPYPIEVYGMGHRTYSDETNVKIIPRDGSHSFWVSGDELAKNWLYVRPQVPLKKEFGTANPRQYYDTFHTENNMPIHKQKKAQIKRKFILREAPGAGIKIKEFRTAKEVFSLGLSPEPWYELTRQRTFIEGTEKTAK